MKSSQLIPSVPIKANPQKTDGGSELQDQSRARAFQLGSQEPSTRPVGIMKALVFEGPGKIALREVPIPKAGYGEVVIRVTLTTICGTDLHILRGEYPVQRGLIIGHEPVGRIHEIGPGVKGYAIGDRVLVGAITPCGQCNFCLDGHLSQCGGPIGGWRFGNTINGAQAEYLLVPYSQANLAKIPDGISDRQVVLLSDIASTGFSAAESGGVKLGDSVAIFAQGPIGLCATIGARLRGAAKIITIEGDPFRREMSKRLGASLVFDGNDPDLIANIKTANGGEGVDVAIEALGLQATFENALRSLKPGGTLSSLGVYSGKLTIPLDSFAAGLGNHKIVTTLCPGGKERMRRLLALISEGRLDLTPLLSHTFPLDRITEAYELFGGRKDNVLKVAIEVSQ